MQATIAKIALAISQHIQENSRLDYQSLFSPTLAHTYPKDRVESILSKIFSEHGVFKNLIPISEVDGAEYFKIELEDGSSSDLVLGLDQNGLIDRFFLGGSIPSAREILVQERVMQTRDGTSLRTLIFQKNDGKPKAVILERSPYLHFILGQTPIALLYQNVAKQFVEDGYAFALQAIRGTGGSEGEFRFLHPNEIEDGFDAVMWAASQDFSCGKVGLVGGSYDGFTAIAAAALNPPPLKIVVASSYFTNIADFGGLKGPIELFHLRWLDRVTRSQGTPSHFAPFSKEKLKLIENVPDTRTYDQKIYGITIPEWQRHAKAGSDLSDVYWHERSIFNRLANINIPTFHIAGMSGDGNAIDTLKAFQHIQRESSFKDNHHFILGYWGHPATPQMYPVVQKLSKRWFAHYLLNQHLEIQPKVRFAAIQDRECEIFQDGEEFPLTQWKKHLLYLDGSWLNPNVPSKRVDRIVSVGGSQSVDELLKDKPLPEESGRFLSFAKVFEKKVTLVGPLQIKLFVIIKPHQADLVVIVRKKNCQTYTTLGMSAIKALRSDRPEEVELFLGPIFESFDVGDELELIISGDAFPTLARNTLAEEDRYFDSFEVGEISVACSPDFPSEISFFVRE